MRVTRKAQPSPKVARQNGNQGDDWQTALQCNFSGITLSGAGFEILSDTLTAVHHGQVHLLHSAARLCLNGFWSRCLRLAITGGHGCGSCSGL